MIMMNNIIDYLTELIPNPKCELNYNKDYELLIAVMLSAQTTDKRVNEVTKILFEKYNLEDLVNSKDEDIIEIVKPLGTFNKKSKNIKLIAESLIKNYNGKVPNDRQYLESLPGVGRKTTNVVLSELYKEPFMAVDTHVARVSKRLGIAKENDDVLKIENKLMKKIPNDRIPDMHHRLVLFGRYYCKAKNPLCASCKLIDICKYKKTSK